jgi:hypothetical protein
MNSLAKHGKSGEGNHGPTAGGSSLPMARTRPVTLAIRSATAAAKTSPRPGGRFFWLRQWGGTCPFGETWQQVWHLW